MNTRQSAESLSQIAILSLLFASSASAQVLDWLPVSDLPLSHYEYGGHDIPPASATMCMWDPDGDGPKPRCVVVAGSLELQSSGPQRNLAYLDADGWVPVQTPSNAYAIATYAASGSSQESLFMVNTNLYKRTGTTWTNIGAVGTARTMEVLDLDGAGPQPPKLVTAGVSGAVYTYDGTTRAPLPSTNLVPSTIYSLIMWDTDGDGPLGPSLLAGAANGIYQWDGTHWTLFASANSNVWSLLSFDFDGDGPDSPKLVASGKFVTLGGVSTGHVAVLQNGTWSDLSSSPFTGLEVIRTASFDPDGPGPLTPWLVAGGQFTQLGGLTVPNLAYYNDGAWHAFPAHWLSTTACVGINDQAGFSNSPQLVVAALTGPRPAFGIFALCDTAPGFRNDPAGGRRPAGETLSLGVIPAGDELSFRWYKGNAPLLSGTTASGSVITGAASPRLTIANLTPQDEGDYHLTVGNAFGTVTTHPASVSLGCAADFNADDIVDFADYLDFITAFVNTDPVSDFNSDLQFDLFDYLDYVQHFAEGC